LDSCTVGVLRKFPRLLDSVIVTGHPFLLKRYDLFDAIIDAGFDYELSTCPPSFVTRKLFEHYAYVNRFKRKILWFLQPHHPYIGETRLDVRIYERDNPREMAPEQRTVRALIEAKRRGILEKAYEDNLKLVLMHVEDLLSHLRGRVVITSDHGEGLGKPLRDGDKPAYGHLCGRNELEVRLIPWCVVEC